MSARDRRRRCRLFEPLSSASFGSLGRRKGLLDERETMPPAQMHWPTLGSSIKHELESDSWRSSSSSSRKDNDKDELEKERAKTRQRQSISMKQRATSGDILEQVNYGPRSTNTVFNCRLLGPATTSGSNCSETFNPSNDRNHSQRTNEPFKLSLKPLSSRSSKRMSAIIILISLILSASHSFASQAGLEINHQSHGQQISRSIHNSNQNQNQNPNPNNVIKIQTAPAPASTGLGLTAAAAAAATASASTRQHQQQPVAANQELGSQRTSPTSRPAFKYHLNHLKPPSLVPITIQQEQQQQVAPLRHQAGAGGGGRQQQDNNGSQVATNNNNNNNHRLQMRNLQRWSAAGDLQLAASDHDSRLVQLQLPLQLHLKLRPLPLPMPPPPERLHRRHRRRQAGDEPALVARPTGAPGGWQEEAKRVLLWNSMAPALVQAARLERRMSLNGSPVATVRFIGANNHLEDYPAPPSAPQMTTTTTTTTVSSRQVSAAQHLAADEMHQVASTTTTTAPKEPTESVMTPTTTSSPIKSEVRRQRHSAQQETHTLDQSQSTGELESRMQAMAAAMLPFVWPSFQLTSGPNGVAAGGQKLRARSLDRSTMAPASWPALDQYTQLARTNASSNATSAGAQSSPAAASEFRPTVVSLDAPLTTETIEKTTSAPSTTPKAPQASTGKPQKKAGQQQEKPSRKKRRKPGYLQRQAAMLNQQRLASLSSSSSSSSSSGGAAGQLGGDGTQVATSGHQTEAIGAAGYPDSVRMASRYPMPRIKFSPVGVSVVAANQTTAGAAATTVVSPRISVKATSSEFLQQQRQQMNDKLPEGRLMQPVGQVPKSLSKLIEQQLQTLASNATNSLNSINGTLSAGSLAAMELMLMKAGQAGKFLAPTTSVSKVVRLPNQTNTSSAMTVISLPVHPTPTTFKFPLDFERINSTKQTTTTTTTTTSTTMRPTTTDQPPGGQDTPTTTWRTITASATVQGQPPTTSTESTGLRHSLEAPSTSLPVARANGSQTTVSTSPPVEGSASASRTQPLLELARNNKLFVEEEQPTATSAPKSATTTTTSTTTTTTTTTGKPKKFGQMQADKQARVQPPSQHGQPQQQQQQTSASNNNNNNNNIKLFHFKRKPDMNKLPFYKKPLNFSDFNGWTSEQIQEHLLELANSSGSGADETQQEPNRHDDNGNDNERDGRDDGEQTDEGDDESSAASSSASKQPAKRGDKKKMKKKAKERTLKSSAESTDSRGTTTTQLIDQQQSFIETTSGARPSDHRQLQSLLKRKRRAKNQFERLMAELQAAAAASAASPTSGAAPASGTSPVVAAVAAADVQAGQPAGSSERVPVMRKKLEPLVMKPMFFVMNQKRRVQSAPSVLVAAATQQEPLVITTTVAPPVVVVLPTATGQSSNRSIEATNSSESLKLMSESLEHLKSKPIVRMRRKHHGDQPMHLFASAGPFSDASAWRPSKPIWSPLLRLTPPASAHKQLVLVPSGLLTPSGSHLMPFYAANGQRAGQQDEPKWRPAGSSPPGPQQQPAEHRFQQHDTILVSPSAPAVSTGPSGQPMVAIVADPSPELPMQQNSQLASLLQQPAAAAQHNPQTTELRVPKLLVKPMRPAKYSLNGYIPKPSLNNNPAAISQPLRTTTNANQQQQQQQHQHQQQQSRPMKKVNMMMQSSSPTRPLLAPIQGQSPLGANKDLDSSTSNEIFSRRRGLQQHQRSIQSKAQLSFDSLVQPSSSSSSSLSSSQVAATLPLGNYNQTTAINNGLQLNPMQKRQLMEENKRKYVQLHQAAASQRSPTLSLQKANQIKAKLGLQASTGSLANSSGGSRRRTASSSSSNGVDSETTWRTSNNHNNDNDNDNDNNQSQQASTSSISTLVDPPDSLSSSPSFRKGGTTTDDDNNRQQEQLNDLAGQSNGKQLIGAPLSSIPKTDFECTDKKGRFVSGLFADYKTGCQVWHLCSNNRKYSFLCPSGTIFNAKVRICDWRYNVKCENTLPF